MASPNGTALTVPGFHATMLNLGDSAMMQNIMLPVRSQGEIELVAPSPHISESPVDGMDGITELVRAGAGQL
jgi:hypothetical protein